MIRYSLLPLCILFSSFTYKSYQPNDSLNTHMSAEEMKETGVDKLTPKEKKALQNWINRHHMVKASSANQKAPPTISEVLGNGHYLKLSDGSLWKIRPEDTPITSSWITPVEIEVKPSGETPYSYNLTNSLTGSTVKAVAIDTLPESLKNPPAPAKKGQKGPKNYIFGKR